MILKLRVGFHAPDGINFHRLEMLVWMIALGGVFIYEVWAKVAMRKRRFHAAMVVEY